MSFKLAHPDSDTPIAVEGEQVAMYLSAGWVKVADIPAGNASLETWQRYAATQGATDEELANLTRNEIREKFSII